MYTLSDKFVYKFTRTVGSRIDRLARYIWFVKSLSFVNRLDTCFIVPPYHVRKDSELLQSKNMSEKELKREKERRNKKDNVWTKVRGRKNISLYLFKRVYESRNYYYLLLRSEERHTFPPPQQSHTLIPLFLSGGFSAIDREHIGTRVSPREEVTSSISWKLARTGVSLFCRMSSSFNKWKSNSLLITITQRLISQIENYFCCIESVKYAKRVLLQCEFDLCSSPI